MKVWFIITIFNTVAAYAGPLSYDMDRCEARAHEMRTHFKEQFLIKGNDPEFQKSMRLDDRIVTIKDIKVFCKNGEDKPNLGKLYSES